MPYIKKADRKKFENGLEYLTANLSDKVSNPGELNYVITKLILNYASPSGTNYQVLNDVLGALEGAKLEFYRRVVSKYEDEKIAANGDV